MTKIKTSIEHIIGGPVKVGRAWISRFVFPREFIGFQGHFPANKILPGACQIQCVLSTIEKGAGIPVALKEIAIAKYFAPVFPDEEVTCTVKDVVEESGEFTFKALITKGDVKVAELKLLVLLAGSGNKRP